MTPDDETTTVIVLNQRLLSEANLDAKDVDILCQNLAKIVEGITANVIKNSTFKAGFFKDPFTSLTKGGFEDPQTAFKERLTVLSTLRVETSIFKK